MRLFSLLGAVLFLGVGCASSGGSDSDDRGAGDGDGGAAGEDNLAPGGAGGQPGGAGGQPDMGGQGGEVPIGGQTAGSAGGQSGGAGGAGGGAGGGGTPGAGGTPMSTGGMAGSQGPMEPKHPDGEVRWYYYHMKFRGNRFPLATSLVKDWTAPPNYYDGSIQVRLVVTANPKKTPIWFEFVWWPDGQGADARHTITQCSSASALANTGTYTCVFKPTGILNKSDWQKPFGSIQQSAKFASGGGRTSNEITLDVGLEVHSTIVIVPAGKTFSGWSNYFLPPDLESAGFKR